MPKSLERKLRRQAKQKGFGKTRTNRYIYGALRNEGWTPKRATKRRKRL